MRLGTCIALELAIAASVLGGAWFGITHALDHAGDYLATREAAAASVVPTVAPVATPPAQLRITASDPVIAPNNVFNAHDDQLLAPIGAAKISKMKVNIGGISLSMRVDFANGARTQFKPEQKDSQADPRREIAAYRMDRLLQIGHVPPVKELALPIKDLLDAADPKFRAYYASRIVDEAEGGRNGMLYGVAQWWIPEIALARIAGLRIDEPQGRAVWTMYLRIGAKIPAQFRSLLEQLSRCILFDVLIDNADRWSGSNTQMSPDGKLLYFMDNGMSFSIARFGHPMNVVAMRQIQVFSRSLVKRMRNLTLAQVATTLAPGSETKLGRLLNQAEIRAIIHRRDNMMIYIDRLIAQFGEAAVLAFP